jgi:hypothetical protein
MIAGMQPAAVAFHAFVGLALLLIWLNSLATLVFVRRPRCAGALADAPFVSVLANVSWSQRPRLQSKREA